MLPPTVIDCVYILKPPDFYNGSREMNPGAFISVAGALPTEISPQPLPPCGFFFLTLRFIPGPHRNQSHAIPLIYVPWLKFYNASFC